MSTVTLSAHECSALFGLPPIGDTVLSGRDAPPTFLVYCGDGVVLTHYMSAHPSTCVVKADVCDGEASCVMHGAEAKHAASMVGLSLIHISEPTRLRQLSRMPSSA